MYFYSQRYQTNFFLTLHTIQLTNKNMQMHTNLSLLTKSVASESSIKGVFMLLILPIISSFSPEVGTLCMYLAEQQDIFCLATV